MAQQFRRLGSVTAALGESPVWCDEESALYWVDVDSQLVHRTAWVGGETVSRPVPGRPGSIALTSQAGIVLVALENDIVLLDWSTGGVSLWARLEDASSGNRLNDGRCDPAGNFVVGSMFADAADGRRTGALFRVSPDRSATTLADGLGIPNGLAFDHDRGIAYYADTCDDLIYVADYDLTSGALHDPRPFFDYRQVPGRPDGACLDDSGCYWSASVYGWGLIRVTPTGRLDRRIEVPLHKPSMPCFAGPSLATLVLTTIDSGGASRSEPGRSGFMPGSLLALDLGVSGVREPRFDLRLDGRWSDALRDPPGDRTPIKREPS